MMTPCRPICAISGATVLLAGCLDLAHTNPFDPGTRVDIAVTGPDAATSLQQIVTYAYTSAPAWPGAVEWRSTNDGLLHSLGAGRFGVVGVAAPPNDTASVLVLLGTHAATRRVVVTQRLAGFTFSCIGASTPCSYQSGQARTIALEGHDANGFRMVLPYSVQVSSTQPNVLRVDSAPGLGVAFSVGISPLTPGTSYLVATASGVGDSVLVTVR
jgi:hypothetical protein